MNTTKQYLLLIDTLRVVDAKQICAQEENEWLPLYLGTEWQPQLDNSPIWLKVTPDDPLWQRWKNDVAWGSSAVIFAYDDDTELRDVIRSLQNNITAYSEDGRLFLLRFYSPYTLSLIAKHSDETLINAVLGLAHTAYLSPTVSIDYGVEHIKQTRTHTVDLPLILPNTLIEELLQ